MPQVNPIDFSFHIKKDDLDPAIKIRLYQGSYSVPFDLTDYSGVFSMAPVDDQETPKVDSQTVNITSPTDGEAEYRWQSGDTDTAGKYYFEFKFTKAGKSFTVPVISPGVVVIEPRIGS